ncbi:hypothetical protein B296_00023432 [Ensete ventricosum]|uniref:Uncharacterized protein n=1 Tax=Ensete ventricosum TaxID=4639 RepID=A0A427ANM4_ENSVE|nr:hypothetical protein B296_00023432 [Ensete ventricosum]
MGYPMKTLDLPALASCLKSSADISSSDCDESPSDVSPSAARPPREQFVAIRARVSFSLGFKKNRLEPETRIRQAALDSHGVTGVPPDYGSVDPSAPSVNILDRRFLGFDSAVRGRRFRRIRARAEALGEGNRSRGRSIHGCFAPSGEIREKTAAIELARRGREAGAATRRRKAKIRETTKGHERRRCNFKTDRFQSASYTSRLKPHLPTPCWFPRGPPLFDYY